MKKGKKRDDKGKKPGWHQGGEKGGKEDKER